MSSVASTAFRGCRALLAPAKSSATKAAPKPKPAKPTRSAGILKPSPVSPALRDFLGAPEASRTEAVKQIWAYIKQNNLQNPANKKEIFCDTKLKAIFEGKEKVGFLEIAKLLSKHFVKSA